MKILFATHFFPPAAAGGTESYTLGLARQMQRLGQEPYVVCAESWGAGGSPEPRHRDTMYEAIPVRRLSWNWQLAPDPFVSLYDNRRVQHHIAAYLDQLAPDVIHITSCYSLGVSIIRAAHRAKVPIILTLTDFWFISPRQTLVRGDGSLCDGPTSEAVCARCLAGTSRLYRTLTRALPPGLVAHGLAGVGRMPMLARSRGLRGYVGDVSRRKAALRQAFDLVDAAIAPSRALMNVYVRNGYPADRLRVSRYGLDLSWVSALRPRPRGEQLCVGYLGQIEPIKGVDVLVRAFRSLPNAMWQLKIFGGLEKNPSFMHQLRTVAADDSRIQFMGQFERGHIADALSQVDVVVVPSVWFENAPLVIGEALAARKPVIASHMPGISELVHDGVNGLLFPRGDVLALADALRRFAEEPRLRERLEHGIRPVRTIQDEATALVDLYTSLVPHLSGVH